jgi:SAM-dependent methyltransferase
MNLQPKSAVRASYDAVADEYVRRIYDELQHKPLDRELLDRFASRVRGAGLVCDLGCGPGHVARYLHERGVTVCGVDLSPRMIEQAKRLNPEIEFRCEDMLGLLSPAGSWAAIAAFYAIVNLPPADLPQAVREMFGMLQPGGLLLLSFHIGDERLHLDDWWGRQVAIDFYFFPTQSIVDALVSAGFVIEEQIEREPYPEVEHPSRRAYIVARKP